MTRKRFKKKLMGLGYKRNDIEKAFRQIHEQNICHFSYETTYVMLLEWLLKSETFEKQN